MGDKTENNFYKDDLLAARGVIETQRSLISGEGGVGQTIRNKIASHEGWVCDAADDWVADFAGKCTPIKTEFDTAWDEVNTAWAAEEDTVKEGHPHGLAYNQGTTSPGMQIN